MPGKVLQAGSDDCKKVTHMLTSRNDVQMVSVSGLTLEPKARGINGVSQFQRRCCAFCVQCFDPPTSPARSSAAALCLFWSVSSRSSSITGCILSSGASSMSWTVFHSQKKGLGLRSHNLHIDFVADILSTVKIS